MESTSQSSTMSSLNSLFSFTSPAVKKRKIYSDLIVEFSY